MEDNKKEIICPHCNKVFKVNEEEYNLILKQVKDKEFDNALKDKENYFKLEKEKELELLRNHLKEEYNNSLSEKNDEINKLKNQIENNDNLKQLEINNSNNELKEQFNKELNEKDKKIQELLNKINNFDMDKKNSLLEKEKELNETIANKDIEIAKLNGDLNNIKVQNENEKKELEIKHQSDLKAKDEQIELLKDYRAKLSTKLLGETLEQHCKISFEQTIRPLLPLAYFEKDNETSKDTGSKGDFIFRDYYLDEDGNEKEYISIMFEMKNENDTTATKHKNEDFFKELDKDRKEKNCEYAVLVSLLDKDSELYTGINDVSYRYEKMYVIRPQFFIPIITLLTNAAKKSINLKRELDIARSQSIDITNFEDKLNNFKDKFSKNYLDAKNRFDDAIKSIDKSIEDLTKAKNALLASSKHLDAADNKIEDLTIKKLTYNNPTMKQKFEEVRNNKEIENKEE